MAKKKTTKPKPNLLRATWTKAEHELADLYELQTLSAREWDLDKMEAACHRGIIQLQMLRAQIIARG